MTEAQATISRFNRIVDAQTILQDDTTAVTTSTYGTVGGSTKTLDVGTGQIEFTAVIDINAIVVGTADNIYRIHIAGSNSSTFANTIVLLATLTIGHATATGESLTSPTTGRYFLRGHNTKYGTAYRYLRVQWVPAGTGLSIDGECYLSVFSI